MSPDPGTIILVLLLGTLAIFVVIAVAIGLLSLAGAAWCKLTGRPRPPRLKFPGF